MEHSYVICIQLPLFIVNPSMWHTHAAQHEIVCIGTKVKLCHFEFDCFLPRVLCCQRRILSADSGRYLNQRTSWLKLDDRRSPRRDRRDRLNACSIIVELKNIKTLQAIFVHGELLDEGRNSIILILGEAFGRLFEQILSYLARIYPNEYGCVKY